MLPFYQTEWQITEDWFFAPEKELETFQALDADGNVILSDLTGLPEEFQRFRSVDDGTGNPEPFTFVPEYNRTIELSDGSITSQFLEKFGRPGRDTGLELERNNSFSVDQSMYLLNSSEVQKRINNSSRVRGIARQAKRNSRKSIEELYGLVLSRAPTQQELASARSYPGVREGKREAFDDLCWALVNSKEFLYHH